MLNLKLSYSHKVLFLVLTIGLIPLIILSTFLYFDKIDTETNSLTSQLISSSEKDSTIISEWIKERKNNVYVISRDSSIVTNTKILSELNIREESKLAPRVVR